jgi:hypothetical protein
MSPRRPSASGFALSIDDDFDDTRNYRVRLHDLEERESTVGKPGSMAIVWKLTIHRDDGTPFLDTRSDDAFETWAWSSDSMFRTAKGRGYVEAFMGRELTDDEVDKLIDDGFAETLVGKTALASFETYEDQDGNQRLKLLVLRPDKREARAAAVSSPSASAPEPAAATPAAPPAAPSRSSARLPRI